MSTVSIPPLAEEIADAMLLNMIHGVGPKTRQTLLNQFGDAASVLAASYEQLCKLPGIGPKLAKAIRHARRDLDVQSEWSICCKHEAKVVLNRDPAFPPLLHEIADPPSLLYFKGTIEASDKFAVAIVGTRHATRYGQEQAQRLATGLAQAGVTVVSGLARGIDAAAHEAALQAGGRTLAVLGGGLARLYPPEHKDLATEITKRGAVMSEFPLRTEPTRGTFPQRNRIISGLALGVVVVEAAEQSGALLTAQHALEQGREVFAVPGPVSSAGSRGCHRLIRDGAKLTECVEDILDELGPLAASAHQAEPPQPALSAKPKPQLSGVEAQVYEAIGSEPRHADQIIDASGIAAHQVVATLTVLELRRLVKRLEGNCWQRV